MKKLSLILICCMILSVLTSCSLAIVNPLGEVEPKNVESNSNSVVIDNDKSVSVAITCENNFEIGDDLELPQKSDAGEYFRQLCNKNDIVIKGVDEGFITSVNSVNNDGDYAWMFYINGEISEVGVSDYLPNTGDKLELKYLNWKELYNM